MIYEIASVIFLQLENVDINFSVKDLIEQSNKCGMNCSIRLSQYFA